jgi:hypothetical protein
MKCKVKVVYEAEKSAELDWELNSKFDESFGVFVSFWDLIVGFCRNSLEKDVVPQLLAKFSIDTLPYKMALRNVESGQYLSQADFDNLDALKVDFGEFFFLVLFFLNILPKKKGAKLLLKRDPKSEAEETISKLAEPEQNKMSLYMLFKTYLKDSLFLEHFFELGGAGKSAGFLFVVVANDDSTKI